MEEKILAEEQNGMRLDKAVADLFPTISRSKIKKYMESGLVLCNGVVITSPKEKARAGDRISIEVAESEEQKILPEDIPLDVVYEDEHLLVVNKPRGMVVHPAPGTNHGTLVNALLFYLGREHLSDYNGEDRPGIVHRIDKDTSGLLVVAKTNEAHAILAEKFACHDITRRYIALVRENMKEEDGTVSLPIGRDPKDRLRKAVYGDGAKPAVTHYRVLERFGDFTLVECTLETGRTHQIRVHMAALKHPLLGDPLYGIRKERRSAEGQYLHAGVLGFIHPITGEELLFEAELPAYFEEKLQKLRK